MYVCGKMICTNDFVDENGEKDDKLVSGHWHVWG